MLVLGCKVISRKLVKALARVEVRLRERVNGFKKRLIGECHGEDLGTVRIAWAVESDKSTAYSSIVILDKVPL